MKAVILDGHGDIDVLAVVEVEMPEPGPEEVLVDVVSSALNRADLLQRMGLYPGPDAEVEIPGLEFAGRVRAVGERVAERSVGDLVMGIVGGGAHAECLVVHERQTMLVPDAIALSDAGAVPEVFITAFDALVVQGGLTSGRTALVHAGASGVGTAAIQICRSIGARVIVTASTAKVEACRALGATAVDYLSDDFVAVVHAETNGAGVDVVLDVIGGDYVGRNIECLCTGGRIIQVGVMDPSSVEFSVGALLSKRAGIIGTVLRARPLDEKIAITQRFTREMLPLLADETMKPVIDSRYSLDDIAAAHTYMASNANIGKIVLEIS
ncbi:MAG: NAD(P)H-quinone oxidoreductase [Acidobacteria bacterium]|nr:NAD(P)H-quinone oxidoreductase [Acidobacteriota bacterium]